MSIHDSDYCNGERKDDWFDEDVCKCGHKHYRCSKCHGVVDGLHDDVNRWDGPSGMRIDPELEEERWR